MQEPKIGMKEELNHRIETEEYEARIEDLKELRNNVTEESTNHTKVQFEETKEKQRTQSLVATKVENFILENVGLGLTLVSTMGKKDVLPVNAEIQRRKLAQQ